MTVLPQAAGSIMLLAGGCPRVCQPSTLRMLIWPEASRAQNSMAAVSAEGSTVCVLMRRLNSSCSRSIVLVEAAGAGQIMHLPALRPAEQVQELAPAPRPEAVPQAPLRPLEGADHPIDKASVGRARTEAAGGLQRVLEPHGDVPPVQHGEG